MKKIELTELQEKIIVDCLKSKEIEIRGFRELFEEEKEERIKNDSILNTIKNILKKLK